MTSLEKALRDFAQFAAKVKGDEKSEAQTFLFHLLEAFGHDANTLPEGATFEYRAVAAAGVYLRAMRREILTAERWSLRDLYRSLETPVPTASAMPKPHWTPRFAPRTA